MCSYPQFIRFFRTEGPISKNFKIRKSSLKEKQHSITQLSDIIYLIHLIWWAAKQTFSFSNILFKNIIILVLEFWMFEVIYQFQKSVVLSSLMHVCEHLKLCKYWPTKNLSNKELLSEIATKKKCKKKLLGNKRSIKFWNRSWKIDFEIYFLDQMLKKFEQFVYLQIELKLKSIQLSMPC